MMTDDQIDNLIDRVKPEIRVAIRAILDGQAVHIFTLLDGRNSQTGARTKLIMFVAHEAPVALLEATANGMNEMAGIYQRIMAEAQAGLAKSK